LYIIVYSKSLPKICQRISSVENSEIGGCIEVQCAPTLYMFDLWNFVLIEITEHDQKVYNMDLPLREDEINIIFFKTKCILYSYEPCCVGSVKMYKYPVTQYVFSPVMRR
jgi:hypothetical protein